MTPSRQAGAGTAKVLAPRRPIAGKLAPLALAIAASLLAGCASDTDPSAQPEESANTVVLKIDREGGFAPVWSNFEEAPVLTVYADGRAFSHGPQIAIFPPPALPNLQVQELSESEVATLFEMADQLGLLAEPPDYGQPPVADAMTTVVTIRTGETSYVHRAYALGIGPLPPGAESPNDPFATHATQQIREALSEFIADATQLVEESGGAQGFVPDAFAVLASPVGDEASSDQNDDVVEPTIAEWPIQASLQDASECLAIDGEQADRLRAALTTANRLTRFEQGGQRYDVAVRPLLPGESCAVIQ